MADEKQLTTVATLVYAKKDDAAGTWLESHFRLLLVLVGYLVLAADAIWIIYRIVKGWLRLAERRAVP